MAISSEFGFRFYPTDEELITNYLKNMVEDQALPSGWDSFMIIRDIYGASDAATPWILFRDDDPWQPLVDVFGKRHANLKEIYVFTKVSNVGKSGDRNKIRRAGCGQWHGNTAKEPIKKDAGMGEMIGNKRTFTFKSKEETVGHWYMYEYELAGASLVGPNSGNNYVLCKIKRDGSKSSKGGRLVLRSNSRNPVVQSNHQGIEPTVQSSGNKRKLMAVERDDECENRDLTADNGSIQEISSNGMDNGMVDASLQGEIGYVSFNNVDPIEIDEISDSRVDNIMADISRGEIDYVFPNHADPLPVDAYYDVCIDIDEIPDSTMDNCTVDVSRKEIGYVSTNNENSLSVDDYPDVCDIELSDNRRDDGAVDASVGNIGYVSSNHMDYSSVEDYTNKGLDTDEKSDGKSDNCTVDASLGEAGSASSSYMDTLLDEDNPDLWFDIDELLGLSLDLDE